MITGVTPGSIGGEAAFQISRHAPSLLVLAGRNIQTLQELDQKIKSETPSANTRLLVCDLSSQESVRKAAEEVNAYPETIDVMINSAGVMATPYSVTKEGLEMQFGTNHIGHFLLTNLILSNMLQQGAANIRVVNVSSSGHKRGPVRFDDPGFEVCTILLAFAFHLFKLLIRFSNRRENHMTNGRPMGKARLQTCFSPYHWRKSLEQRVYNHSVFIQDEWLPG